MYFITAVVIPVAMIIVMWGLYRLSYSYRNGIIIANVVHVSAFMLSIIFLFFHIYMLSIGMMSGWWLLISYLLYNIAPVLDVPLEHTQYYGRDDIWDMGLFGEPNGWLFVGMYVIIAPYFWYVNAINYLIWMKDARRKFTIEKIAKRYVDEEITHGV